MQGRFAHYAAANKPSIETELATIFKQYQPRPNLQTSNLVHEIAGLVARGGKRSRPLLLMLCAEGYGVANDANLKRAAASQELLHSFLLIHDDIIDRDLMRWGGPNITGVYLGDDTNAEAWHAAESRALLAGDICLTLANQSWLQTPYDSQVIVQALAMQQQVCLTVIGGELADSTAPMAADWPTVGEIIDMYYQKTASYSFILPLKLGALLGGVTQSESQILEQIGKALGIAYQLQDDVLGIFGSSQVTGKPVLHDLREGKRTVMARIALDRLASKKRQKFLQYFGNSQATEEQLLQCASIIQSSGARDAVEVQIADYVAQAASLVSGLAMANEQQAMLADFIDQLTSRQR